MAVLLGARRYHRRWCKCLVWTLGLCLLAVCGFWGAGPLAGQSRNTHGENQAWAAQVQSRRLQSVMPNCTPAAIEQFPRDLFTPEQRKGGVIVLHIAVAAYMFLALAIACDDYFVPSLEVMCDILHLQTDVAGATFMAAGSSAPELATAVIAVFIAKDDVGLGTVVGSAVYNVTFVIGLCALFAGMVIPLNWWPLLRDCIFYTISVIALVLVLIDELVFWPEALGLILLYVVYIIIMYFNPRIEAWIQKRCSAGSYKSQEEEITIYEKLPKDSIAMTNMSPAGSLDGLDGGLGECRNNNLKVVDSGEDSEDPDAGDTQTMLLDESCKKATDGEYESPLKIPSGLLKRILWVISLPLTLIMYVTVPDCRRGACRKWFAMTFIMSLVWLSIFSYLIVWMITIIGHTFGIPDTVMGLTFIAFGVSIPDAISSLIVIREGYGDMGVSNAVGSNIFDILICLGIPWFLETTINDPGSSIQVYSQGLFYSAVTLLSTVALLLIATHVNGWKLNKPYGVFLLVVYILFMVLASLYELNVFGYFQPPECHSNF